MYKPSATDFVFIEIINTGQTWILWFGAGMLISAYSGCAVLEHQNTAWKIILSFSVKVGALKHDKPLYIT